MPGNAFTCHLAVLFFVLFDLFCQVVSDFCGNDKYCQSPYKCCANSLACCYDNDSSGYSRGFKLHVWNMWYFWLVVIFILMSCFGGCGYYRRRRLAALQQSTSTSPSPRTVCMTRQRHAMPPAGLYAYTGPGAVTGSTVALPPPYTEVMQQPNLYPMNKVELPPYPGPPADKGPSLGQTDEVSPPPYCEVAMPSSQATEGISNSVQSNHVAVPMESVNHSEHISNTGSGDGSTQAASSS